MRNGLRRFVVDERGQDLVEYALLAALVATASIAALSILGNRLDKLYTKVYEVFPPS